MDSPVPTSGQPAPTTPPPNSPPPVTTNVSTTSSDQPPITTEHIPAQVTYATSSTLPPISNLFPQFGASSSSQRYQPPTFQPSQSN